MRVEYLWLGKDKYTEYIHGDNTLKVLRKIFYTKVKTINLSLNEDFNKSFIDHIWSFDGSSTGHIIPDLNNNLNTEIILKPVKMYKHPFDLDYLILCECYYMNGTPHESNTRSQVLDTFKKYEDMNPWFGLESEYLFMDNNNIYGWNMNQLPEQNEYYCGTSQYHPYLRNIVEEHYNKCLNIGIHICGYNAEVMPSQWEFQIGPYGPICVSDDLTVARYILERLANEYQLYINYHPKPLKDYNGSGCHHNFSCDETRSLTKENYKEYYERKMESFNESHKETLEAYGDYNKDRLTGIHETSNMNDFTYGYGTRHTSIRVPLLSVNYIEDRRPSANCDPYLSCEALLKLFLDKK